MEIKKRFEELPIYEKNWLYLTNMRPVLNSRALFHDATEDYLIPCEPEKNSELTIRFRTLKYNVEQVNVIIDGIAHTMSRTERDEKFDYYSYTFNIGESAVR